MRDRDPSQLRGRLARARALQGSFLTSGAVQALSVLTGVVLARVLGPHDRGELAAVLLWPTALAAAGSLGIPDAATYFAARPAAAARQLVGTALALAAAQSAVLVGVGVGVVRVVHAGSDPSTRAAAYVALAVIPASLATLYLMNLLNGLQRFTRFQALRFLVYAAYAAALAALALGGGLSVVHAVLAYLGAHALTGAMAAVALAHAGARPGRPDARVARELLGYGIRSHLSGVSVLLNERLDQLVISIFLAPALLGVYVIAVTLTSLTALVGTSVALVALPAVASLASRAERTAASRRFVVLTLGASAAVSLGLVVFVGPLVRLFFGSSFEGAVGPCRILLVAAVLLSLNRTLESVLKAVGRPLDAGVAQLAALAVTVAALAALLPPFGLVGAGVASLLAYGVGTVWLAGRAARALGVAPAALVLPRRSDLRGLLASSTTRCASIRTGARP